MDRKRRLMENNNGWPLRSQLFDGAPFRLPLLSTAVPASAATGTTATFTRATAKTWPNNDGYLVTGVAGEIGFPGARRVDNLIRLGAAQSSTLAVAANVTMTLPAGAYQFSMGAGTGTVTFSGTGGATGTLAASALGRTFVAKTISAGTLIVTASVATLTDIQVVSMVAETDQTTLREYVSVGVASAPYYHGSMVDGVRAFPNDLSGNPIPSTTLLGYSAEGARTNYALWNRDLTNVAWVKTNCTAALTATGADNAANSASTLTATAGNATCLQSITRVSAQRVTGCKIKRRTGTGTINMTQDNGVTWTPVTVTSAYTNVAIPAATAANPIIGFQIVTNGDAIDVDFVMHEEAAFVSSSIATTTIAVARNADVLTYSIVGNVSGTVGWCYAEVAPNSISSSNQVILGANGANRTPAYQLATSGSFGAYDGTNAPTFVASAFTANAPKKVVSSWGSAGLQGAVNGAVSPATTFDGNYDFTDISVGTNNSSTNSYNGNIKNVRIGQRQLSSSELQAITA